MTPPPSLKTYRMGHNILEVWLFNFDKPYFRHFLWYLDEIFFADIYDHMAINRSWKPKDFIHQRLNAYLFTNEGQEKMNFFKVVLLLATCNYRVKNLLLILEHLGKRKSTFKIIKSFNSLSSNTFNQHWWKFEKSENCNNLNTSLS